LSFVRHELGGALGIGVNHVAEEAAHRKIGEIEPFRRRIGSCLLVL
jgi:hypothetical protein